MRSRGSFRMAENAVSSLRSGLEPQTLMDALKTAAPLHMCRDLRLPTDPGIHKAQGRRGFQGVHKGLGSGPGAQ